MAVAVEAGPPPRLLDKYNKEIVAALGQKFNRKNRLSLPKLTKIVLNMGVGKALQDKERMKLAAEQLGLIADLGAGAEVQPEEPAEPPEAHEDRPEHGRRQGAAGQGADEARRRAARADRRSRRWGRSSTGRTG